MPPSGFLASSVRMPRHAQLTSAPHEVPKSGWEILALPWQLCKFRDQVLEVLTTRETLATSVQVLGSLQECRIFWVQAPSVSWANQGFCSGKILKNPGTFWAQLWESAESLSTVWVASSTCFLFKGHWISRRDQRRMTDQKPSSPHKVTRDQHWRKKRPIFKVLQAGVRRVNGYYLSSWRFNPETVQIWGSTKPRSTFDICHVWWMSVSKYCQNQNLGVFWPVFLGDLLLPKCLNNASQWPLRDPTSAPFPG